MRDIVALLHDLTRRNDQPDFNVRDLKAQLRPYFRFNPASVGDGPVPSRILKQGGHGDPPLPNTPVRLLVLNGINALS